MTKARAFPCRRETPFSSAFGHLFSPCKERRGQIAVNKYGRKCGAIHLTTEPDPVIPLTGKFVQLVGVETEKKSNGINDENGKKTAPAASDNKKNAGVAEQPNIAEIFHIHVIHLPSESTVGDIILIKGALGVLKY